MKKLIVSAIITLLVASQSFAWESYTNVRRATQQYTDCGKEILVIDYMYEYGTSEYGDGSTGWCGMFYNWAQNDGFFAEGKRDHVREWNCCAYGPKLEGSKQADCGKAYSDHNEVNEPTNNGDSWSANRGLSIHDRFCAFKTMSCESPQKMYSPECAEHIPPVPTVPSLVGDIVASTQAASEEMSMDGAAMANLAPAQDTTKENPEANAATGATRDLKKSAADAKNKYSSKKAGPGNFGGSSPGDGGSGMGYVSASGLAGGGSSNGNGADLNAATDGEKDKSMEFAAGKKAAGSGSGKTGFGSGSGFGHETGLTAGNMGGQGSTGPVSEMSDEDYFKMAGNLGLFERVNKKYGSVGDKFIHEAARDDFDRLKAH